MTQRNMRLRTPRGWRAQIVPGRVFELRRKTYQGNPVCVLCLTDSREAFGRCFAEINSRGCVEFPDRDRARFYVGALSPQRFNGGLVRRRRPDLERFDADDIALIKYGIGLRFGGAMLGSHHGSRILPEIGLKSWTTFWVPDWYAGLSTETRGLDRLLHGDWHCSCYSDRRRKGWATAKTCPAALRAIENELRRVYGHVERASFSWETQALDDGRLLARPFGTPGPVFSTATWVIRHPDRPDDIHSAFGGGAGWR